MRRHGQHTVDEAINAALERLRLGAPSCTAVIAPEARIAATELAVTYLGEGKKLLLGVVGQEADGRVVAEGWWRLKVEKDREVPAGVVVVVPWVGGQPELGGAVSAFDGEDWAYQLSAADVSRAEGRLVFD